MGKGRIPQARYLISPLTQKLKSSRQGWHTDPCKSKIMMTGLSSAGRITKELGTMWDHSIFTVQQENPGSQLEPGIGLRRAPLIFGDIF